MEDKLFDTSPFMLASVVLASAAWLRTREDSHVRRSEALLATIFQFGAYAVSSLVIGVVIIGIRFVVVSLVAYR
jgi:hypothetical protein